MVSSKECFKCKTVFLLSEFYKHPGMKDGHLNKCIECTRTDTLKRRLSKLEQVRAYDRKRGKLRHRIDARTKQTKIWRQADKRRMKCHNAVSRAVKKGDLVVQPCEKCGSEKVVAHHEDYNTPLDVVWLCQACHVQRHMEILAEKQNA